MAKRCSCYVLNVGQGSATFVVVYDNDLPVAAVLTDLGSGSQNRGSKQYTTTIDMIASELNVMRGGAKLNLLVLSHSDNDHINLLGSLLDKFSPDGSGGKPKLTIGKCVYGGWYGQYKKEGTNVLDSVASFTTAGGITKVLAAPALSSGFFMFGKTLRETKLIDVDGLSVTTLLMNAPRPSTGSGSFTADIEINTRSIVVVATYTNENRDRVNFIITGDATGPTFFHARESVFGAPSRLQDRLKGTVLMTVPHHGSARTATCYTPVQKDAAVSVSKWTAIDNFISDCQGKTAVASAGNTSHRHPRWSLLNRFFLSTASPLANNDYIDPKLALGTGHFYSAYFDAPEWDALLSTTGCSPSYGCFATVPAMFTTYYFYPAAYYSLWYPSSSGALPKLPDATTLVANKEPLLVYWRYDFDNTKTVKIAPVPFALSSPGPMHSPFVGSHPVSLGAATRAALRERRPVFMAPLTTPAPRARVLA